MLKLMFSRNWWWTTLLVLAAVAVTIRLGFWQLDRHAQRQELVAQVAAMQASAPISLDADEKASDLTKMEYRTANAVGVYDFEHQVAIRNQIWTQSWGDENGYALLTPLILANGTAVLVERGWIPAEDNTPESWRQFDEPGTAAVEGIIRLPQTKGEIGGVPDPTLAPGETSLDFWNYVNIDRIQQQMPYPLLDVYIQQTPSESQTSLPYRSLPEIDLSSGTNLGYALQWFFFAGLLVFGYPIYLKKHTGLANLKQAE
jgi:surfeit locus 1 family protein